MNSTWSIGQALFVVSLLVFSAGVEHAQGACTGASPNWTATPDRASVLACVNSAASGDIISVASGSATYSSPIALPSSKDLEVIGATSVNCTGDISAATYACATIDRTILTCSTTCFEFNLAAKHRISGFTMTSGGGDELVSCLGQQNSSKNFRIDHNHMISTAGWAPIRCKGETNGVHPQGVWDHNRLEDVAIHTNGTLHQLSEGPYQHTLWAQSTPLGNSQAVVYIESNHFSGGPSNINSIDGNYAGRAVVRFNRFSGQTYIEFHSPQGENRGFQRWEVYNNILKDPSTTNCYFGLASIRGGTGVVFNNLMSGDIRDCNRDTILDNVRSNWAAGSSIDGIRACDGQSPWDQNLSGQTGWHCRDQIGVARDITSWNHGSTPTWNQELRPAYFWNNLKPSNPAGGGSLIEFFPWVSDNGRSQTHIQVGRDYHVKNATFNGTTGVGMGPRQSMPATCSVGVAYWVTDEGEWNSLNSGPDGRLYRCLSANTWTLDYTPYLYPHPWASGGGGSPPPRLSAPTNLRKR